jgi:hypothetical protein
VAFRYPSRARGSVSRTEPYAAWPGDAGLPSVRRPTALLGFNAPFAGLLPRTGGRTSQARRLNERVHRSISADMKRSFCSAFLPVRAHVSFVPLRPPRLIFVGVTDRLLEKRDLQKRSTGDADGVDFWASTPVCGPPAPATHEPGTRSCLGLCLLQGCRALTAHRPGSTPVPITRPRNVRRQVIRRRRFLSAHGFDDDPSNHVTPGESCSRRAIP